MSSFFVFGCKVNTILSFSQANPRFFLLPCGKKSFFLGEYFPFKGLECTFKVLERPFKGSECTFQPLERKIPGVVKKNVWGSRESE